jgi:hypothetical protein
VGSISAYGTAKVWTEKDLLDSEGPLEGADGSLEEKNMKSLLAATAVAALAFGFAEAANAAPAVGGVNGVRAVESTNLVQQAAYYHRHRHCAWRHGRRVCWWR